MLLFLFFFFKQKTAYDMRISDWSSDVCSSDRSPIDLIPDFVPVLGFVDDLIILPLGIWLFTLMIPKPLWSEYRATAEAETQRPISLLGAAIVVAIWLALAVLIAFAVTNWQYY